MLTFALPDRPVLAQDVEVDLELVLAVDISLSMDDEEQRLQRDGYVAAIRHPEVIAAIRDGANNQGSPVPTARGASSTPLRSWSTGGALRTISTWIACLLAQQPGRQTRIMSIATARQRR